MPVPTHREGCRTSLWATNCLDCGDSVYFFQCSCGSRVFFDLNRPPWNPHENRCIPYLIRYLRDNEGRTTDQIIVLVDEYASIKGLQVPPEIRRRLTRQQRKERRQFAIAEVKPDGSSHELTATVLDVDWKVNLLRKAGYSDSQIGRALLGKLGNAIHARLVLRGPPDPADNVMSEFSVYVPAEVLEYIGVGVHSLVSLTISTHTFANGERVWIGRDIKRLKAKK